MKKIYYLKTCDTCKRIMRSISVDGFEFQEIKSEPISEQQLVELRDMAGSYEALFSRRAKKYREMGLKDSTLEEDDFKQYILSDYTFLQRPVIVADGQIFIGSGKKNVKALEEHLKTNS